MPANLRTNVGLCAAFCMMLVAAPTAAAADAALLKDLASVIALLGLPCGQVVAATALKDDDHIATCRDGTRYRVFINAEGRVVARQQSKKPVRFFDEPADHHWLTGQWTGRPAPSRRPV